MWLQRRKRNRRRKNEDGQSLLETAVTMPLLFAIAFNIINLAYFWFMVLTLSAVPRMGAQYSAQGGTAIGTTSAPTPTQVSNIVYENMTNAVSGATAANTAVRVCMGVAAGGGANCTFFGPAFSFPAAGTDPEGPTFSLNRVDVEFTVTPPIPGSAFGVLLPGNMQFHRQVSMRSLF